MKFDLKDLARKYNLSWMLPEAIFWDLLENITILSGKALVNGFPEAFIKGPYKVEVK